VGVIPEPFVPSPKSHENDAFATVELDALKKTVSPTCGSVGEKTKFADPAGSVVYGGRPLGASPGGSGKGWTSAAFAGWRGG